METPAFLGQIGVTAAIAVLVIFSSVRSISAVSVALHLNIRGEAFDSAPRVQAENLTIAATVLERQISGSEVARAKDGSRQAFLTWAIPPFFDTIAVDAVSRLTGKELAIYVVQPVDGSLVAETTTMMDEESHRFTGITLGQDTTIHAALSSGQAYTQHNIAMVEETNAAIEQTEAQAVELDRIVETFRLDHTDRRTDHPGRKEPSRGALVQLVRATLSKAASR